MFYFSRTSRKKVIAVLCVFSMTTGIAIQEIYGWNTPQSVAERLSPQISPKSTQLALYKKPATGTSISVPVIVYHSIRPTFPEETPEMKRYSTEPHIFEQELVYLKENNYKVISFSEMLNYFDYGIPLPEKPVILTFDDGWKNQYLYAFPLLKKYGFTGTFFVFTNAMGHKNYMSWDQLREMDLAGMTIAGHTKTHPYLTKITDPEILTKEISGGKKILETQIGKPVLVFAYPFGLSNPRVVKETLNAGYRIGRTSDVGSLHTEDSLPRLTALYDKNNLATFIKLLNTE